MRYTLFPVNNETRQAFEPWEDGPPFGRVAVDLPDGTVLKDDWTEVTTRAGRRVEVRSADCGLGCHCAGEVRLAGTEGEFRYSLDELQDALFYVDRHGRGVRPDIDAILDAAAPELLRRMEDDRRYGR